MWFQPGDRVVLRNNFYNYVGEHPGFAPGNSGTVTGTKKWQDWLAVAVVVDGVDSPGFYEYNGWIFDSEELDRVP